MKRRKIAFICGLLFLLGSLTATLGTYAYLHAVTQSITNVFTSDKSISIQLREPSWDGYTFEDATTQNGEGIKDTLSDDEKKELGYTLAHHYLPGWEIPKNPTVKNNGTTDVSVYTALKVRYYDENNEELTYADYQAKYLTTEGLDFDTTKWSKISDTETTTIEEADANKYDIYLFNEVLAPGEVTTSLFTEVPISTNTYVDSEGNLPQFKIEVTAYAIQADGITEDVEELILNLVNEKE